MSYHLSPISSPLRAPCPVVFIEFVGFVELLEFVAFIAFIECIGLHV